jgi:hypothetical protein
VTRRSLDAAAGGREFDLTTVEDLVIHKLEWFRAGGGVSERRWRDVVGLLAIQRGTVDLTYLTGWADALGLGDALARALADAADRRR